MVSKARAKPVVARVDATAPEDPPSPSKGQQDTWLSVIRSYCTFGTVVVLVVLFFVYRSGVNMYYVTHPTYGFPPPGPDTPTIDNLWPQGRAFDMLVFISMKDKAPTAKDPVLWRQGGLLYQWDKQGGQDSAEIVLVPPGGEGSGDNARSGGGNVTVLPTRFWKALRAGKDVYLHVYITRPDYELPSVARVQEGQDPEATPQATPATFDPRVAGHDGYAALHGVVPLIKRQAYTPPSLKRKLLSRSPPPPIPEVLIGSDGQGRFWKPEVAVRLVTDWTRYPLTEEMFHFVKMRYSVEDIKRNAGRNDNSYLNRFKYLPPIHADEIGLTSDKYVGVNSSVAMLPLSITYSPMGLGRWQLMQMFEQSLRSQAAWGFDDKDIDDVRRLISDTNVWLLMATLLASVLHLLFEFLAFQSDINFWRKNKSLRGLSVRSIVIDLGFQVVIFLYLCDSGASLLVLGPSAFGVLVQVWKVQRATGLTVKREEGGRLRVVMVRLEEIEQENAKAEEEAEALLAAASSDNKNGVAGSDHGGTRHPSVLDTVGVSEKARKAALDRETMNLDRVAIAHMSMVLFPVCVGFAVRSLIMEEYTGWYSWCLSALTSWVYSFGFALMCPQLYINYKLKSVAHLPWRFLCYRFVNTFIDDLFSFVIRMPTMHRVSCFRDDVVFLVYLYQRWIYPVDHSRQMDAEDCAGG